MTTSTPTLACDLVAALAELENPHKDATADVGTYAYRYATLSQLLDIARPVLGRHRLALLTPVESAGPTVTVRAVFLHGATGETFEAGRLELPRGNSAQQLGSAVTYARRYLALAALGLAAEDDDGAGAAPLDPTPTVREPSPNELAAVAMFGRLKELAGTPTADSVKQLAANEGRRLTVDELGAYPAFRRQVADLLAALEDVDPNDEPTAASHEDETAPEPARTQLGSRARRHAAQNATTLAVELDVEETAVDE